jgi:hypothetical protein
MLHSRCDGSAHGVVVAKQGLIRNTNALFGSVRCRGNSWLKPRRRCKGSVLKIGRVRGLKGLGHVVLNLLERYFPHSWRTVEAKTGYCVSLRWTGECACCAAFAYVWGQSFKHNPQSLLPSTHRKCIYLQENPPSNYLLILSRPLTQMRSL